MSLIVKFPWIAALNVIDIKNLEPKLCELLLCTMSSLRKEKQTPTFRFLWTGLSVTVHKMNCFSVSSDLFSCGYETVQKISFRSIAH